MSDTPINTAAAANKLMSFLTGKELKPKQLHVNGFDTMEALQALTGQTAHIFTKSQGLQSLRDEFGNTAFVDMTNTDDFKNRGIVGLFSGSNVYLLPEDTEMHSVFAIYQEGN